MEDLRFQKNAWLILLEIRFIVSHSGIISYFIYQSTRFENFTECESTFLMLMKRIGPVNDDGHWARSDTVYCDRLRRLPSLNDCQHILEVSLVIEVDDCKAKDGMNFVR